MGSSSCSSPARHPVVQVDQVYEDVRLNAEQEPGYGNIRLAGHDGGDFLFVRKR